jgi:hypothetical protein
VTGILNESQRRHPISVVPEVQNVVKNGIAVTPICAWCLHIKLMKLPLNAYASCATKCYQNSSVLSAKFRRHLDTNYPECKDKDFSSLMGKLEAESYGESSKTDNENAN